MKKIIVVFIALTNFAHGMQLSETRQPEDPFSLQDKEYEEAFKELDEVCNTQCCIVTLCDPYVTSTVAEAICLNTYCKQDLITAASTSALFNVLCICCVEPKLNASWNDIYSIRSARFLKSETNKAVRSLFPGLFSQQKAKAKQE